MARTTFAAISGEAEATGNSDGWVVDQWCERQRGNFTGLRHSVCNALGSSPFELLEVAESLLRIRARSRDPAVHAEVDGAARRVQVVSGEIAEARRLLAAPPRPAKEA